MINYLSKPFKWFFKLEAASGLILLIAAIFALLISNSYLSEFYFEVLDKYLFIGVNDFSKSCIYFILEPLNEYIACASSPTAIIFDFL